MISDEDLLLESSQRPLLLYGIGSRDRRGRPMLIELVGQWDCQNLCDYIAGVPSSMLVVRHHHPCRHRRHPHPSHPRCLHRCRHRRRRPPPNYSFLLFILNM